MKKLSYILACVLILSSGCGQTLIAIREDPEILPLKEQGFPRPEKVTVAPIRAAYDRELYNETRSKEDHAYIPEFESETEQSDIVSLFADFNLFNSSRQFSGLGGAGLNEIYRDAFANESDFVAQIILNRFRVSFFKFAGSYIPNMIGWVLFTPTSWFVHDEVYKSEVFVDFKLLDVYSHLPVYEKVIEAEEVRALNDFQRGWKLFGIFRAPGFLQVQNYEKIHRQLTPFAIKIVKKDILESIKVGEASELMKSDEFKYRTRRITAICAGVSKFLSDTIRPLKYAGRDGELMHQMLTDYVKGAAVNPDYCVLLKDQQASKDVILKQIDEIGGKRTGPNGTFIFFFAGYGFTDSAGESYIVPCDGVYPDIPAKGISFTELKTAVGNSNAGKIVFVFDCAFMGGENGRSIVGTSRDTGQNIFSKLTEDSRVTVISSVTGTQNALEFESLMNGLFTYYFSTAVLEKTGDVNIDGNVSLEEMFLHAKRNLTEISAYKGARQEPVWLGDTGTEDVLVFDSLRPWLGRGFIEEDTGFPGMLDTGEPGAEDETGTALEKGEQPSDEKETQNEADWQEMEELFE